MFIQYIYGNTTTNLNIFLCKVLQRHVEGLLEVDVVVQRLELIHRVPAKEKNKLYGKHVVLSRQIRVLANLAVLSRQIRVLTSLAAVKLSFYHVSNLYTGFLPMRRINCMESSGTVTADQSASKPGGTLTADQSAN